MYALRILIHRPLRLILTVSAIAGCIMLMLFLLAIYRGVADGSVEYIRKCDADVWVLQKNATNILRGSSILSTAHGYVLREMPEIEKASPVLLLLSTLKITNQSATVFLTGFDPASGIGGPPQLVEGRPVTHDDEIVLDKSFASKYHCRIGEWVRMQDDSLHIVGISSGTNAFVIQYAFVTIAHAQRSIGYPNAVTCWLVKIKKGNSISEVVTGIREELPGVEAFDHQTFLENNIHEMESGFLPILYAIASMGAIVLTIILSLLLSMNILEMRKDFAVMKILGAPGRFLPRLITGQSLQITSLGSLLALALFFPAIRLVESISPEISTTTSFRQILSTLIFVGILGLVSTLLSMSRLRHIYPLEVYR